MATKHRTHSVDPLPRVLADELRGTFHTDPLTRRLTSDVVLHIISTVREDSGPTCALGLLVEPNKTRQDIGASRSAAIAFAGFLHELDETAARFSALHHALQHVRTWIEAEIREGHADALEILEEGAALVASTRASMAPEHAHD